MTTQSPKTAEEAYTYAKAQFARMANITGAGSILSFDQQTAMARGSADDRTNQTVALSEINQTLITDPRLAEALDRAESDCNKLSPQDQRNLKLMRREWVHKASIPNDLASARARMESEGENIHVAHFKTGTWSNVVKQYEDSFRIMHEVGEAKREKLGLDNAHDALFDEFSTGLRISTIDPLFAQLDRELRRMIPEAMERQAEAPAPLPIKGPFGLTKQLALGQDLAKRIGFDFSRGVLASIKGHPSCGGTADDARITTRLDKNDVVTGLYAVAHETGHAVYQQGLPAAWRYQPAGNDLGMAIHETQSMVIEYQACMSAPFIEFLSHTLQSTFKRAGDPTLRADNIRAHLWRAEPSFIRIDADELTYSMHVLLRYDLEKAMMRGDLKVKDLPGAWNEGIKARLGITPANDNQGCMQDVHWPVGAVGYFPAYTFGAIGATQFFKAATQAHPEITTELGAGNFSTLKHWLNKNVHSHGALVTPEQLFTIATGEPLNVTHYLNHLSTRYLGRAYTPS